MGKSIDLVFVANNHSRVLWEMTAMAIRSAKSNAGVPVGTIVTIEQCLHASKQSIGKTIYYDAKFNYNDRLNLGLFICNKENKSEYIAFCNNDLYFHERWALNAIRDMEKHGYLSACPHNSRNGFEGVKEGYRVGKRVLGWCIITNKKVFDYIGKFDTPVNFWYSDNVYAIQIQCAGIKHALIGSSKVRHLVSKTLKKLPPQQQTEYMKKQEKAFNQYKIKKYANTNAQIKAEAGNSH